MSPGGIGAHHGGVGHEDALLERFRADGHAASMEALVVSTRSRLLGVARRIGAPQDAEDSVQAGYHALLRREERPDDVVGWLVATVVRIAYRRKAVARRESAIAERLARSRDEGAATTPAMRDEEAALVRDAVHRLPARYRDVLVLHHLEELPLADVARLLDVPLATAKTRAQRGRALLRLRLASRLVFGIVAFPWRIADAARAAPVVGGIVQAKTTVAALVLVGAAVAVGVVVHESAPERPGERPATVASAAPVPSRTGTPRSATRTRRRAEDAPPAPAPTVDIPAVAPGKHPVAKDDDAIAARVAEAAKGLGVSSEALRAAEAAYSYLRNDDAASVTTTEDLLRDLANPLSVLKSQGEQGFLALIALLRGGRQGTYFQRLVPLTDWRSRLALLIDLAEKKDVPQWVDWTALQALGTTDAPEARDYLVARMRRERDPGLTMCTAESLGELKEPRGVQSAREFLRSPGAMAGKGWSEVTAAGVLNGVMCMDKDAGGRLLAECVRDPEFSYPAVAIEALGSNGREDLARAEATAFLAAHDVSKLSAADAQTVWRWAGEKR